MIQLSRLAVCLYIMVHLFIEIVCGHEKNPVEVFIGMKGVCRKL